MTPKEAARIRAKKATTIPCPNLAEFEKKRMALEKAVKEDEKRAQKREKLLKEMKNATGEMKTTSPTNEAAKTKDESKSSLQAVRITIHFHDAELGDQKYIQRALKLTTSWVSEKCCMYCDAALSGPHLYTFFGENAPHRSTLKSTTDFIVHGCRPNPWIRIPGFDISIVMTDWLHLVDLAITPEMAGSVNCLCISSFTCGLHQQVLLKWSSWFTGKVVFDV